MHMSAIYEDNIREVFVISKYCANFIVIFFPFEIKIKLFTFLTQLLNCIYFTCFHFTVLYVFFLNKIDVVIF